MQRVTSIRTINCQNIIARNVQLRPQLSIQRCKQIRNPDGKHMFETSKSTRIGTQRLGDSFRSFALLRETLPMLKSHGDLPSNPISGKHNCPRAIGIAEFGGFDVYIKTNGKQTKITCC